MSSIITDLLDRKKGGSCKLCGHIHDVKQKCNFQHLASIILKLREANSFIPQILQANKEAVDTAKQFQEIIRDADHAHTILMEILSLPEYPDGELIKQRYLEELDRWAKRRAKEKSTDQGTQEQLELSIPEDSTQSETPTTSSTSPESGSDSQKSSSNTTPSATSVEESPK